MWAMEQSSRSRSDEGHSKTGNEIQKKKEIRCLVEQTNQLENKKTEKKGKTSESNSSEDGTDSEQEINKIKSFKKKPRVHFNSDEGDSDADTSSSKDETSTYKQKTAAKSLLNPSKITVNARDDKLNKNIQENMDGDKKEETSCDACKNLSEENRILKIKAHKLEKLITQTMRGETRFYTIFHFKLQFLITINIA